MENLPNAGNITGGTYPARIWTAYMKAALEGSKVVPFPEPAGINKDADPPPPTTTAAPAPTTTRRRRRRARRPRPARRRPRPRAAVAEAVEDQDQRAAQPVDARRPRRSVPPAGSADRRPAARVRRVDDVRDPVLPPGLTTSVGGPARPPAARGRARAAGPARPGGAAAGPAAVGRGAAPGGLPGHRLARRRPGVAAVLRPGGAGACTRRPGRRPRGLARGRAALGRAGAVGGGHVLRSPHRARASAAGHQRWFLALWVLLTAAVLAGLVVAVGTVRRHPDADPVALALSPVLALTVYRSTDLLPLALAVVALWAWSRDRERLAGVLGGLALLAGPLSAVVLLAMLLLPGRAEPTPGCGSCSVATAAHRRRPSRCRWPWWMPVRSPRPWPRGWKPAPARARPGTCSRWPASRRGARSGRGHRRARLGARRGPRRAPRPPAGRAAGRGGRRRSWGSRRVLIDRAVVPAVRGAVAGAVRRPGRHRLARPPACGPAPRPCTPSRCSATSTTSSTRRTGCRPAGTRPRCCCGWPRWPGSPARRG